MEAQANPHLPESERCTVTPYALAPELLGGRITVVDDVITRGATVLAAASRIAESSLNARVAAFALLRTVSDREIARIVEPTLGTVRLLPSGGTRREP